MLSLLYMIADIIYGTTRLVADNDKTCTVHNIYIFLYLCFSQSYCHAILFAITTVSQCLCVRLSSVTKHRCRKRFFRFLNFK